MFPFETEIKLRFKPGARAKFFSKSEASTRFPSELEAKRNVPFTSKAKSKFSKSSAESASTPESVASTYFPSEPETKMERGSRFEASTKSPSEAEVETKSPSEAEANVKTPESEAKMNSPSEPETSTAEPEAEASTKFSTKPLASTNIFKNIEVNTTKATRKPSTRSKEISFEIFLNKIGARKLSTEKPKLSSENSEANLLKTTPSEAVTEANNTANLINNEAASTNIIKTEAETNENIETNPGSTLEAKFLVSKFEAKSEANTTKSTYPIKSEATSEIYSKNVETITEAALFLANTTNLGVNVAATTSEEDSAYKREFEQTIPLAGIEATIVANIVATSKPVASVEATSIASNQATSTPEASIKATLVGSNEAASLAKVNSTSASNIEANTESTSLINSRTNVVSTSPVNEVSLKLTLASLIFDKNTKENIEAKSVVFSTAKSVVFSVFSFVAEILKQLMLMKLQLQVLLHLLFFHILNR
uniref:Uncharacterized protein n=1 Tax=Meloidogyne enterolobii TaxID=390850 RepID=A0A6V7TV55_MELEN|nr:unnamed protein product [Meloidogyne enterolobii]